MTTRLMKIIAIALLQSSPQTVKFQISEIISVVVELKRVELIIILHLQATGCRLPYGITQSYLPPDTSEHTLP